MSERLHEGLQYNTFKAAATRFICLCNLFNSSSVASRSASGTQGSLRGLFGARAVMIFKTHKSKTASALHQMWKHKGLAYLLG